MIRYILLFALLLVSACSDQGGKKGNQPAVVVPLDVESIAAKISKTGKYKYTSKSVGSGQGSSNTHDFVYDFDSREIAERFIYDYRAEFLKRLTDLNVTQTDGSGSADDDQKRCSHFGYGYKRVDVGKGGFVRIGIVRSLDGKCRVELIFWEIL